jgi:hypothetical protein
MDGSGVIGIDEPNAPIEADKAPTALERYFRTDLGFNTPIKSYRGVNFDANRGVGQRGQWRHQPDGGPGHEG